MICDILTSKQKIFQIICFHIKIIVYLHRPNMIIIGLNRIKDNRTR